MQIKWSYKFIMNDDCAFYWYYPNSENNPCWRINCIFPGDEIKE